jgi:hypothetical protein
MAGNNMDIRINGNLADITIETERTVGDVLSGLDAWLNGSGHTMSGLRVDGNLITADGCTGVFDRDLSKIGSLDILTSPRPVLTLEALHNARQLCETFAEAAFNEQVQVRSAWEASAASAFLSAEMPDIADCISRTVQGEGLQVKQLCILIDERIREITDPSLEIQNMDALVSGIVQRLEDLPLDTQTGKDGRAAETVSLFSNIAEKLFRLLLQLKSQGETENLPAQDFLEDFSTALKELLAAYEAKDSVLIGDLAEYELAPRLGSFYAALKAAAANIPEAAL